MKVALIGCGAWGKNLARVFHDLGVLGMVCDPGLSCSGWSPVPKSFRRFVHVPMADILRNPDITAVAIATPANTHSELAYRALQAGKDVFIEKPMALHRMEGVQLQAFAEAYDRILMVGHIMEYHPAIMELTGQVYAGELGEIEYIISSRLQNGQVREEGLLWSLAPHDVAVVLRLMGKMPSEVRAWGDSDMAGMVLRFNGVCAQMNFSWVYPIKRRELVVKGSKKTLLFDGVYGTLTEPPGDALNHWGWVGIKGADPLRLECQAFIDACTTRVPPLTDGASGLRVLSVIEAATHE